MGRNINNVHQFSLYGIYSSCIFINITYSKKFLNIVLKIGFQVGESGFDFQNSSSVFFFMQKIRCFISIGGNKRFSHNLMSSWGVGG